MPVKAEVAGDCLLLSTDAADLGSWPLAGLEPQARGAGVGLLLDGDPVVIDVGNADLFLTAVSGHLGKPGKAAKNGKVAKTGKVGRLPRSARPESEKHPRRRPSPRVLVAGTVVAAIIAGAWLAPTLVGSVALFVGLVLVVIASGAVVEPQVALRIPFGLVAMHLMVAGVGTLLVGVILTFLG